MMNDESKVNDRLISKITESFEEVIKLAKAKKLKIINIVAVADEDGENHRVINTCYGPSPNLREMDIFLETLISSVNMIKEDIAREKHHTAPLSKH